MLDEEPDKILYDLLRNNWDNSNTPYSEDPRFHTGSYDFGSSEPQVSATAPDDSVVGGGDTDITAITGSGGVVQRRVGTVYVNCWSGTFKQTRSSGVGNPKNAAFQLGNEARQVLLAHAQGTRKTDGTKQLWSLAPGQVRRRIEDSEDPTVFRYEVETTYTYVDRT